MVLTRKQKQASIEASDTLKDAGILQHVFTFLPGCWLIGAVCKEWNVVYTCMDDQEVCRFSLYIKSFPAYCDSMTTLYSAAVASPATVRLACDCGLAIAMNDKLQFIAGLRADEQTLTVLQQLGMPLSGTVVRACALSGRLHTLQHLITEKQCPIPKALDCDAACSGSVDVLKWLKSENLCAFNDYTCEGAAERGQLAALQYLRSEGCEWEGEYVARLAASSGSIEW
jgi:hypothetical protein